MPATILSTIDRYGDRVRAESGSIAEILEAHAAGTGSPSKTAARVADAIEARGDDGTWLSTVPRDELLAAAAEIERRPDARTLPLYGVPFGVKDSIDVAGVPTTLSCPDFSYVMASCIDDVDRVFAVMAARDDDDPWSRDRGPRYSGAPLTVGLPAVGDLEFFGDAAMRQAHLAFRERLAAQVNTVEVSLAPFLAAGELLYQGPWVAERLVVFGDFLDEKPDSIHPVVREILEGGRKYTAVDAFTALQRLQELRAEVARVWRDIDVLVVPTIGTTFTVDQVLAAPIDTNTMLGHYTHFGNLLDLLGVAVPAGTTADGRPHSVTVLSAAQRDDTALHLAARILDEPRPFHAIPSPAAEPTRTEEHA